MLQYEFPSGLYLRKWQRFGNLQHAPQWTHSPLRLEETGNTDVKVLFAFAAQVFRSLSAITKEYRPITQKCQLESHPMQKMTYAQLAINKPKAISQTTVRSGPIKLIRTALAKSNRTRNTTPKRMTREYRSGL